MPVIVSLDCPALRRLVTRSISVISQVHPSYRPLWVAAWWLIQGRMTGAGAWGPKRGMPGAIVWLKSTNRDELVSEIPFTSHLHRGASPVPQSLCCGPVPGH